MGGSVRHANSSLVRSRSSLSINKNTNLTTYTQNASNLRDNSLKSGKMFVGNRMNVHRCIYLFILKKGGKEEELAEEEKKDIYFNIN